MARKLTAEAAAVEPAKRAYVTFLAGDADDQVKKKMPPPSWLAEVKDVMFARKNQPAMATLAASLAGAGVVATAANPAICFGFYAVFMAAIAVVTISISGI